MLKKIALGKSVLLSNHKPELAIELNNFEACEGLNSIWRLSIFLNTFLSLPLFWVLVNERFV